MKNNYLFGLFTILILASCQDYYDEPVVEDLQSQSKSSLYNIPIDSALAYLNDFIKDENMSRDGEKRAVANIIPIRYNMVASRTEEDSIDCENLLYVANFENDLGYSILAADTRISDKVIAVVDGGNLSSRVINSTISSIKTKKIAFYGYPTAGDGFFTTPETGEELFINPNTVSWYMKEPDDTLVGNYFYDPELLRRSNLVDTLWMTVPVPEYLSTVLSVEYAKNEIRRASTLNGQTTINGDAVGGNTGIPIDGGGGPGSRIRREMRFSDWSVAEEVPPILSLYKYWNQDSPFNELYPECHRYILFGERVKARAGCFPLAISKIMTHFERPAVLHTTAQAMGYHNYTIDWSALKESPESFMSDEGKKAAAHLLKTISSGCHSLYFADGTFTFPSYATAFMRGHGFGAAHNHGYTYARVTSMLDNGKPLIIYAIPGINIKRAHVWNIDGYKVKERTVEYLTYKDGELIDSVSWKDKRYMVHCDFGWGGSSNGYFVSGVFNFDDYRTELDSGQESEKHTNYNHYIKVVTY